MRPVLILQAGAGAAHGVGHRADRLFLADHARPEALLHVHEFLVFAFLQAADRDAGPRGNDAGDVLVGDLLLEDRAVLLQFRQTCPWRLPSSFVSLRQVAIGDLRGAGQVADALGPFGLALERLDLSPGRRGPAR